MTDVSEIAERLRAVLNDGLSSVAICNKNDLRAILDDRERLMKERDEARAKPKRAPVEGEVGEQVNLLMNAERLTRADQRAIADLIQRLAGQVAEREREKGEILSDYMTMVRAETERRKTAEARLREAAKHLREHNRDYQYRTPEAFLATLEDHSNG